MPGVSYVRTSDLLCTDTECPLVIGGVRVYRNAIHLTKTFATSLAPLLARRIETAAAAAERR